MKKLTYRPCFKMVVVEILKEKKKEESKVLLPEDMMGKIQKFVKCRVVDYSKDCILFKSLMMGQERFAIVENSLIEEIEVDNRIMHIVPEHAIVLISSEG